VTHTWHQLLAPSPAEEEAAAAEAEEEAAAAEALSVILSGSWLAAALSPALEKALFVGTHSATALAIWCASELLYFSAVVAISDLFDNKNTHTYAGACVECSGSTRPI
jgi:hypothetical protein